VSGLIGNSKTVGLSGSANIREGKKISKKKIYADPPVISVAGTKGVFDALDNGARRDLCCLKRKTQKSRG